MHLAAIHAKQRFCLMSSAHPWIALAVLVWLLTGAPAGAADPPAPRETPESPAGADAGDPDEDFRLMKMFVDALDEVQRNAARPVTRRELVEAAIEGIMARVDMHSDYIPPAELDTFRQDVDSEFGGVGIQVEQRGDRLFIVSPLAGSPALRAGIIAQDEILAVDGEPVEGWGLDQAVTRMKGRLGTILRLTVQRGESEVATYEIERDRVRLETVLSHMRHSDGSWNFLLDDTSRIGYVRIRSFSAHTTEELRAAMVQLEAAGMRGFILDLRFNPGGLLTAAVEVADLFLHQGRIVSTAGRNVAFRSWEARAEGTLGDFPMIVLVNQYSASASEIVAAALQDHGRAVVVGERTFGKGSVQKVVELEGGRSALKLTTSSYVRPNGENIDRPTAAGDDETWGVRPDDGMQVSLTRQQLTELLQYQGQSFVIPGSDQPAVPVYWDPQLQRAVDELKSRLAAE